MTEQMGRRIKAERRTRRERIDARLVALEARGFDRCREWGGRMSTDGLEAITVGCSQCAALVIQGVACHETGCPRETRECDECGAAVPKRQRVCASCAEEGL